MAYAPSRLNLSARLKTWPREFLEAEVQAKSCPEKVMSQEQAQTKIINKAMVSELKRLDFSCAKTQIDGANRALHETPSHKPWTEIRCRHLDRPDVVSLFFYWFSALWGYSASRRHSNP